MTSRREFLRKSAGYILLPGMGTNWVGRSHSRPEMFRGLGSSGSSDPLARAQMPSKIVLEGPVPGFTDSSGAQNNVKLPFSAALYGDQFPQLAHEVLANKSNFLGPGGKPPKPDEFVDLAIVGGGLAGLTAAYALRHRNPVVFEYAERFGGNSKGETWRSTPYSMGGAYLIDPDPGPLRDTLNELGLDDALRAYSGEDAIEVGCKRLKKFFDGEGSPPEDAAKFEQYKERLQFFAFKDYPEMPTGDGSLSPTVADLDKRSLKTEITSWVDGSFPELLEAAIQLYCYSSFNAGWEEVSAASGLNFLAAEEYDLWVYPGGLGQVASRLWKHTSKAIGADNMRPGLFVFDVRQVKGGVQITYIDSKRKVRSMVAKVCVMAAPKKVYQWLDDSIDATRLQTIRDLKYRSYCVANVLLNVPTPDDFYDLFLIHDGVPGSAAEASEAHRITDALSARWVSGGGGKESVLTCYWPMPFDPAALHFTFGTWNGQAEKNFRQQCTTSVLRVLKILDLPPSAVNHIRLTRWAHSMPVSPVGFYNAGKHNVLREPVNDRIFFANQDNWALPAIETSMMEAFHYVPQIEDALDM